MLQNACEGGFYHVMAFAFLFEMSQIKEFQFRYFFFFKIDHVLFIRNATFFYDRNI